MGMSGSLEKLAVTAYKDANFSSKVGEYTAYINPGSYSHNYKICYTDPQAQGSNGGSPDFNRVPSDKVDFELVFDGTGVVPSPLPGVVPFTGDGVTEQIDEFKKLVFSYNGNIHSPNYLKLVWGTMLFRCRLSSLNINYTMFKPDGTPLRARAKASFIGFTDEVELAKKANKSSPDMTHEVTVRAGDRLPLLCFRIYGTCAPYLAVAAVNGLTDVRQLEPGTKLLFPPLRSEPEAEQT